MRATNPAYLSLFLCPMLKTRFPLSLSKHFSPAIQNSEMADLFAANFLLYVVCGGDTDKMLENITPTRLATKKTAKKRSSGNEHWQTAPDILCHGGESLFTRLWPIAASPMPK